MSVRIQYELQLLGLSFLTGAWLMVSYDVLRIFRLMIRHNYICMGIEDFLYWVYAGLVTFTLLYSQNDGVLRAYAIGGVLGGMAVYDRLVSRILFRILKKCAKWLKIKRDIHKRYEAKD